MMRRLLVTPYKRRLSIKRIFTVVLISLTLVTVGGCKTVGGAAVGAGIGALAGDAGKGAVIGASVGAVADIID
jgi:hypothetical protein